MLRAEVLQGLLDLFEAPRYLEIGVHSGETLLPLRAAAKVGVDPEFRFDIDAAAAADPTLRLHPVPSDAYFLDRCAPDARFDVVFLDGLHTLEQTLRDLMNTLAHVEARSVIVIDDVLPSGPAAAIRDLEVFDRYFVATPGTPRAWMGDVYRLVWFIAAFMPAWSYATVAENHGQLVLWREARAVAHDVRLEEAARIAYPDVVLTPDVFRLAPFADIRTRVRRAVER